MIRVLHVLWWEETWGEGEGEEANWDGRVLKQGNDKLIS